MAYNHQYIQFQIGKIDIIGKILYDIQVQIGSLHFGRKSHPRTQSGGPTLSGPGWTQICKRAFKFLRLLSDAGNGIYDINVCTNQVRVKPNLCRLLLFSDWQTWQKKYQLSH